VLLCAAVCCCVLLCAALLAQSWHVTMLCRDPAAQ
jgi:hypothetical protein